jgi:hypothetical protein
MSLLSGELPHETIANRVTAMKAVIMICFIYIILSGKDTPEKFFCKKT